MIDDDELGRPVRHERPATRSAGKWMDDVLRRGRGPVVRVRHRGACGCGAVIEVDFEGPDDSLGADLARRYAAGGVCGDCLAVDEREREAQEEVERHVERVRRRVESCGLPGVSWRERSLGDVVAKPGQEEALRLAGLWASGESQGLLLHGEVGAGKTFLAAAAAVSRCSRGPARWLPVAELLMGLRMPFESAEYGRAMRKLEPAGRCALVLDDLDKTRPSEHALQPLYVAVNRWLAEGLPLLVTLNRDLESLARWGGETFGDALASRLAGYCDVVEMRCPDWRLV